MRIEERLTEEMIDYIKNEIVGTSGVELLFIAELDQLKKVSKVTTAARGNAEAVPALFPFMESGDVVIHNHPSGLLLPSQADISIASRLGNQGIGFYIIDNLVSRIHCVCEAVEKKVIVPLDPPAVLQALLPGGILSRKVPAYEYRESQAEMTEGVIDAFNMEKICIAEAGTGVGKSYAYLLPAIIWTHQNSERVVVSTATINLQQQLMDKDIPMLVKLLECEVKSVLVKGRGNYICRRKLRDALEEATLFEEENSELNSIGAWAEQSITGEKSDLSFLPSGETWGKVCSETDFCLGLRCGFREECFVIFARREAASADILVVNHHLLFSDLAMRVEGAGFDGTAVLPPFKRLIFDEAHTMERTATSFFSRRYSKYALFKLLQRIYGFKKGRAYGLIKTIEKYLDGSIPLTGIPGLAGKIREKAEDLDRGALQICGDTGTFWLKGDNNNGRLEPILQPAADLQADVLRLISHLDDIIHSVTMSEEEEPEILETRMILERLKDIASLLGAFQDYQYKSETVFWLNQERSAKGDLFFSYTATPLEIGPLMHKAVFEPHLTVICTSATLSVKNDFSFWAKRVGAPEKQYGRVHMESYPSPFQYRKHVLLAIPIDAPLPTEEHFQDYLISYIGRVLETTEGRGLVLFTSYGLMNTVYEKVLPLMERTGITVLKQGDDDRGRLLIRFRSDISSVLFATDSFWEGVDAPGDSLSIVIICRLPFRVPTEPVLKARMEAVEKRGGNPFMELALPDAAVRLKQGFGRLMRHQNDRGIVMILDARILRKRYGPLLIGSLPETLQCFKNSESVLNDLESFLYSEPG